MEEIRTYLNFSHNGIWMSLTLAELCLGWQFQFAECIPCFPIKRSEDMVLSQVHVFPLIVLYSSHSQLFKVPTCIRPKSVECMYSLFLSSQWSSENFLWLPELRYDASPVQADMPAYGVVTLLPGCVKSFHMKYLLYFSFDKIPWLKWQSFAGMLSASPK